MLRLAFVEQFAWHEIGGDAEESAEETADGGETAGELCVVGCVRVLDGGVDDGADTETDACPYDGSNDD
jgi:hypothetical protein